MENYLTLFPPRASSSYHFTAPPSNFTSSMVSNTQLFASLHESGSSRGLLGVTEETKSLLSSYGQGADAQMETSRGSESEAKASKKKGEKKVKKPRYAFQTRSQVDILDDGYRWRKYGQKAVKNNKFPRSYYRCTHQGCNVKKQVQRLSRDEGVVVTTYEGMHTHPIEKSNENFEHILNQMQIYPSF